MDPGREPPYWPAAVALLIDAGQMTASDYLPIYPDLRLHPKGRPQTSLSLNFRSSNDDQPVLIFPRAQECAKIQPVQKGMMNCINACGAMWRASKCPGLRL